MRQSFFDYCRLYQKQNLLDEWDAERNLPLTPQTVTYGSHKSAWWRCENGHEWKAAIYTRSDGARCPYCTGRKVMVGFNDLATQSPELARQWDYEKMCRLFRRTSVPEVIDPSGGAAKKDTAGAQASIPALPGAAVRSAPGGRFSLERTTLRRWIRSWHRNGTRRATAS